MKVECETRRKSWRGKRRSEGLGKLIAGREAVASSRLALSRFQHSRPFDIDVWLITHFRLWSSLHRITLPDFCHPQAMAEPMEISSPEHSRKRSLPDDDQTSDLKSESQVPTPPLTASPNNKDSIRQPSPAPSSSTLSSAPSGENNQPADPNAPPKKRRKYTPAEKEQRRLEKEQKDKERAELKIKRDEEKQKKDEEKRRKNEEKEAKQREKDLKKTREEEEKQKKARVSSACILSWSFAH